MGTRATYQFDEKDDLSRRVKRTTIYCHWDNYPSGAASRFARAVEGMTSWDAEGYRMVETTRGGMLFAFIRANGDAEPTEGHHAHGDTEYNYDVWTGDSGLPMLHMRARQWHQSEEWRGVWTGSVARFVNTHREGGTPLLVECCEPRGGAYVATIERAKLIASGYAERARLTQWDNQRADWTEKAKVWAAAVLATENQFGRHVAA